MTGCLSCNIYSPLIMKFKIRSVWAPKYYHYAQGILCFLPFPLSSFPSTFGITELTKGFFPHIFNTLERQDYVGPMPEECFYDPDGMSDKKETEFQEWHAEKVSKGYVFNP